MVDSVLPGFQAIPSIPATLAPDTRRVLEPMRAMIQLLTGAMGNGRALTVADLSAISNGVLTGDFLDLGSGGSAPPLDTTPPPSPTGLSVVGAVTNIMLSWDPVPAYYQSRLAYTEIWRAPADDIAQAVKVGTANGSEYADNVGASGQRFYWIRYVSKANIAGPFNAQAGTAGATSADASYLIDLLSASPPPGANYNPLLWVNADPNLVVNGVPVPTGTYLTQAYIGNGTISRAMIGLAAIDDARIADLHASKITAGDISADRMTANIVQAAQGRFDSLAALSANLGQVQIGQYGFLRTAGVASYLYGTGLWMGYDTDGVYRLRIGNPNGDALWWDGNNLHISGDFIAKTVNAGSFTSYAWPPGGGEGAHMSALGVLMGNPTGPDGSARSYFQYDAATGRFVLSGTAVSIFTPKFSVDNDGNAHFAGDLTGANGRFDGTLRAAIVDTDQLIDRSITHAVWIDGYIPSNSGGGTVSTDQNFTIATDSYCLLYVSGTPNQVAYNGYAYAEVYTLSNVRVALSGDFFDFALQQPEPLLNQSKPQIYFLPAGTYTFRNRRVVDNNNNGGWSRANILFIKR